MIETGTALAVIEPSAQPVLSLSPHPFAPGAGRVFEYGHFFPGETLAAYLERTGIAARLGRGHWVLTIDGRRLPRALWHRCRPKTGTLIHIYAAVRGGSGGKKNPIAIIAIIAVMIFAWWAAPLIVGAMGIAAGTATSALATMAVSTAINVVGGMVINSLFPPPKPQLEAAQGSAAASPTYSIHGGANRVRRYEPMPKIVGVHKVFPDFGAMPYSQFDGDDQVGFYLFDFGYNDVELSDYRVGDTPLTEFPDYELEESGEDGKIDLFPANVDTLEVSVSLEVAGAFTVRTSSPGTTRLQADIVGVLFGFDPGTGNVGGHHADFEVEYRAAGAVDWLPFFSTGNSTRIANATRTPVRRTFARSVPEGQYEVRLRIPSVYSQPETDAVYTNELAWSQLRSYQPDRADYTGRKRVAIAIRASGLVNGALRQFSAIARARCQVWNGAAWAAAHTSNPAWWALDAARGKSVSGRRVWGGGMADAAIDIEGLKLFAAWCAAEGLSVNGVFDQQLSVHDMLSAIALAGRGTLTRATGKLGVVWDAPAQPVVAVFGMHNIVAGSFEIDYTHEDLAEVIEGEFINPELGWQRDFVRVNVPGAAGTARVRRVQHFLCTNRAMCAQNTNLLAANNAYRTRRYRWRMDWEGMPVSRGEVGALSHDLASMDYSGRLIEGGSNAVLKLSRKVPLAAASGYLLLVKPDGSMSTHAADGGAGETDTLNLATPLGFDPCADPDHPPWDYRFLYGATPTPGRKVKIERFKPVDERTVELHAIDELPEYYLAKNNPYSYTPPRPVFGAAPVLSNLEISEDAVRSGTGYLMEVTLTWDVAGNYGGADVQVAVNGAPSELRGSGVRARRFAFTVADGADIAVEVTGYSDMGALGRSAKLTAAKHIDFAGAAPPGSVAGFVLEGRTFSWTQRAEFDVVGYEIRFHYGRRDSFDDANRMHLGLLTHSPKEFPELPAAAETFLIVAVDAAGLRSLVATPFFTDRRDFSPEGDLLVANVVATIDLAAAGYPGTVEGGGLVGGDLEADATDSFYDSNAAAPMYGPSVDPFYGDSRYTALTYTTEPIVVAAALAGSRMILAYEAEGEPLTIEYRAMGPGPMYGPDTEPFYGEDDDPFYDAPPDFRAWLGGIVVKNDLYELRFRVGDSESQGALRALAVEIDARDIVERPRNVAIAVGGSRLPIARNYLEIQNVQVTRQADGGSAVDLEIADYDAELGPLVIARNAAGASVAALVNANIQGY